MKTKFLVTAILLSTCLTSWGYPKSVTKEKISQIRLGQTTEADLVNLFGPPTTRFVDMSHISLDWFRSVPMSAASYLPFIGELTGGLHIEAQQLSVVLSPDGRVLRYEMHSSKDKPRDAFAEQIRSSR
jgi:hypothetical protein